LGLDESKKHTHPFQVTQTIKKQRMKYQLIILSVLLSLSVAVTSSAQGVAPALVASKNGYEKRYRPGTRLCIKYGNDSSTQKTRGIFTDVVDGKIVIAFKKKSKVQVVIPVEDITMLRKIKPGKRILYAAAGTALVAGGAAVIEQSGNSAGSGMATALVIPVIGAGVYTLCAVPVSLLFEKMGEKKRSSGWSFSVQQYR
jgi:hypothetical protein